MTKGEILIIFVLAVLVTGLGCLYCVPGEGIFGMRLCGWPMSFAETLITWRGSDRFLWKGFLADLLFWFLVLAGGWWVTKKLKSCKMRVEVFKNEKS